MEKKNQDLKVLILHKEEKDFLTDEKVIVH